MRDPEPGHIPKIRKKKTALLVSSQKEKESVDAEKREQELVEGNSQSQPRNNEGFLPQEQLQIKENFQKLCKEEAI